MKRLAAALLVLGLLAAGAAEARPAEIVYQIFTRSFRDSNGDRNGDLDGVRQGIPYLKSLGVTTVLLTPTQPSPFYHNYFPSGFEDVDPAFGDEAAFQRLIAALHAAGMKLYLDEEFQYVAEGNPWLEAANKDPDSTLGRRILADHGQREGALGHVMRLTGWNGKSYEVATVDLANPAVRAFFADMLARQAREGVDGFRLDHMMDDLDNKHRLTHLFADFWGPILARVRAAQPGVVFVAEQAEWSDTGRDWLTRGGVDAVFAMPLRFALVSLDKAKIEKAISDTAAATPPGKEQLIQIENHDVDRFASLVASDPAKERLGAAFDLFLQGVPLIYYGQELGMRGLKQHFGPTDANDIPQREAFRWQADEAAPEAATWYQGDYPWWKDRFNRSHDGVSVEEQDHDPASLLNWHRKLISLRRERPEWTAGDQKIVCPQLRNLVCLRRTVEGRSSLLIANLSPNATMVEPWRLDPGKSTRRWLAASGAQATGEALTPATDDQVHLDPWGVLIVGSP
jgi:alpha-amylase